MSHQTKIKTSTGIWNVTYNAYDRPIKFTKEDGSVIIDPVYDYQGRRTRKKVTTNGTVTLHEQYVYDGNLQIMAYDIRSGGITTATPIVHRILWDPTEPTNTRPLAICKNEIMYAYLHDLNKNVIGLRDISSDEAVTAINYEYTPYGQVTITPNASLPDPLPVDFNPIQWSSEVYDPELDLTYYNYRHYNPADGRWINRDPIGEKGGNNLYGFVKNNSKKFSDRLGYQDVPNMPSHIGGAAGIAMENAMNNPCPTPKPIDSGPYDCGNPSNTLEGEKECLKCCSDKQNKAFSNFDAIVGASTGAATSINAPSGLCNLFAMIGAFMFIVAQGRNRRKCDNGCKCK